jgi:hypothetical protein
MEKKYYLKLMILIGLLIPSPAFSAVPYTSYNDSNFDVHLFINTRDLPDVIAYLMAAAFCGFLTTLEYQHFSYIMKALEKGDRQILAIQKDTIDRIYKRIQERRERALAFGYNLWLTPADEHDMAWAYNEQKEMQAYYDQHNNDYIHQLKRNFKWKATGHGVAATISSAFTAFFGYLFYKEIKKLR